MLKKLHIDSDPNAGYLPVESRLMRLWMKAYTELQRAIDDPNEPMSNVVPRFETGIMMVMTDENRSYIEISEDDCKKPTKLFTTLLSKAVDQSRVLSRVGRNYPNEIELEFLDNTDILDTWKLIAIYLRRAIETDRNDREFISEYFSH